MEITPTAPSGQPPRTAATSDRLREAAQEVERSFLAEMLKAAGLGQTRSAFGGGAGEDQFASFLVDEQARAMVRAGGIGLTDRIYQSLVEKTDDRT